MQPLSLVTHISSSEAVFGWHQSELSAPIWSFEAGATFFLSLAALGSLVYLYGALAVCALDVFTALETSLANVDVLVPEALGPVIRTLRLVVSVWA